MMDPLQGRGSSQPLLAVRRSSVTRMILCVASVLWAGTVLAQPRTLTLEEAIGAALESHEAVRAASAEEQRAEVTGRRAYAIMGPTVVQDGSYTQEKEGINFPPLAGAGPSNFNTVVLQHYASRGLFSVGQPLYTHQFWALRSLGKHEAERARQGSRVARENVTAAVIEAYYDLLRARALSTVAEETAKLAKVEVSNAEARVAAGEAVKSDVIRAQTEVARAAQRVVESQGAIQVAADRLSRLTGVAGPFEVIEPPPRLLDASSVDHFVDLARDHNPELQETRAAVQSARDEQDRLWAALLPTAGFQFDYKLVNHEAFAELNNFWDFIFAVRIPLLEGGGRSLLDWSEQRARVARAEAELQGLSRDVELGVRQAFVNVNTFAAQEGAAQTQASLAAETYRLLSEQYTSGVATGLDVLDALTARDSAQANVTVVHYSRALAAASLERAAGILGEEPVRLPGGSQ
jgi:outer membrane protein TolC